MNRLPPHYIELERVYAQTIGQGLRSLAVTATEPGEGVSTLAGALAQRNHLVGRATLLVDLSGSAGWPPFGDLGFDGEHAHNGGDWRQGLTRNGQNGYAVLRVSPHWKGNLTMREADRFGDCLREWLDAFDTVIFDTAPLNASNGAEVPAERICAGCDATLLVVLACRTPAASVTMASARLRRAGAKLLGTVINDRFNPNLAQELLRETFRFDRWLPALTARLRSAIRRSRLLNLDY